MNDDHAQPEELRLLADLNATVQKPAASVNIDGSFELGFGSMLLLGMIPVLMTGHTRSQWTSWISLAAFLCMAFAPFAVPKLVKRLITWPRTGYVANANELKLGQLVLLMIFGGVVGIVLGGGLILLNKLRSGSVDLRDPVHLLAFVLLATIVAVYLGKRVMRKRTTPVTAFDTAQVAAVLRQAKTGHLTFRAVNGRLLMIFAGAALMLAAIAFGILWLGMTLKGNTPSGWARIATLTLLIASNTGLYVMCNAMSLKQHPWKYAMACASLFGPAIAALLPLLPVPQDASPVLLLIPLEVTATMGLIWAISGVLTLCAFIRHNPLPSPEIA